MASKKGKGGSKKGHAPNAAQDTAACLCHSGREVACRECMDISCLEVAELTPEEEVSIEKEVVEAKLKLIPCTACRDAALEALPSVTEIFVTQKNGVSEGQNSEGLAPASESRPASKKKKKGKAVQNTDEQERPSSVGSDQPADEVKNVDHHVSVEPAPPKQPEGCWLIRIDSSDSKVLKFKINTKRKPHKESAPLQVTSGVKGSGDSSTDQALSEVPTVENPEGLTTDQKLAASQAHQPDVDPAKAAEMPSRDEEEADEDERIPPLVERTISSFFEEPSRERFSDAFTHWGVQNMESTSAEEGVPYDLQDVQKMCRNLSKRSFVFTHVLLQLGLNPRQTNKQEWSAGTADMHMLKSIGVQNLQVNAVSTVKLALQASKIHDDLACYCLKSLCRSFTCGAIDGKRLEECVATLQKNVAATRNYLRGIIDLVKSYMDPTFRTERVRDFVNILDQAERSLGDDSTKELPEKTARCLYDMMTVFTHVRVASRFSEIMTDTLIKLYGIIQTVSPSSFVDEDVHANRTTYLDMGEMQKEIFFALEISESAKTIADICDLLAIDDISTVQDWLEQRARHLPLVISRQREPENKTQAKYESLKSHDTIGSSFTEKLKKLLRGRAGEILARRKLYSSHFEFETNAGSHLKILKSSLLQEGFNNMAEFFPELLVDAVSQNRVEPKPLNVNETVRMYTEWWVEEIVEVKKRLVSTKDDEIKRLNEDIMKMDIEALTLLASDFDRQSAYMTLERCLASYILFVSFSAWTVMVLKTFSVLGCIRACHSPSDRREYGLKVVSRHISRLIVPSIPPVVETARLMRDQAQAEARERKRKEAEEKKKAEEREREAQKRLAEEARRKQEKREEEERLEKLRQEREERERLEEMERARKAMEQAITDEQEGEFQARRQHRVVVRGGRRVPDRAASPNPHELPGTSQVKPTGTKGDRSGPNGKPSSGADASVPHLPPQIWACSICTFHNQAAAAICEICNAPKPEVVAETPITIDETPQQQENKNAFEIASTEGNEYSIADFNDPSTYEEAASNDVAQELTTKEDSALAGQPVLSMEEDLQIHVPSASVSPKKVIGLSNDTGENSCFLNVVVQSLWHLSSFSEPFLNEQRPDDHLCARYQNMPCIVCSLRSTFAQLDDSKESLVSSVEMRRALFAAFDNVFSLGEKHDAGEALERVLAALHFAMTGDHDESNCDCIVHRRFGSSFIEGVRCNVCKQKARTGTFDIFKHHREYDCLMKHRLILVQEYTSFLRYVSASLVAELADGFPTFKDCLQAAMDVEPVSCPVCDKKSLEIERLVLKSSSVYTLGIIWQSNNAAAEEIKAFLESVSEHLDIGFESQTGLEVQDATKLCVLRGMMCYYGSHYAAFFCPPPHRNPERLWYMFDDSVVKLVGRCWYEAAQVCLANRFQPVALCYEADATLRYEDCNFSGYKLPNPHDH